MDPTDKELREQLAHDPFPNGGFDERLRRRIEANLDRPKRSHPRKNWAIGGAAVAMLAVMIFGIWQWSGSGSGNLNLADRAAEPSSASQMNSILKAKTVEPLETAMLVGLRKDVDTPDGRSVSSYRTLLIAPEGDDKLAIAAEGKGIVMPYNQSFWMLDSTADDETSSAQGLTAYEAYSSKKLLDVPAASHPREGLLGERLLYVGHEYVSVMQEASSSASTAGGAGTEYRFVQSLKQLSESLGTAFDPQTEPHLSLNSALAVSKDDANQSDASLLQNEQWSVVRKTGSWAGAAYPSSGTSPVDITEEQEVAEPLSDQIARDNSLSIDWQAIRSLEPGAIDAFTSTNQQLLAVVLDRELKVYPYGRENAAANAVSIELDPGESIIMVQWSVERKYTDLWVTKVNEIFQAAASNAAVE